MTSLVRDSLRPLVSLSRLESAHAGLLLNRALSDWEDGEKQKKSALIERVAELNVSELYKLAFDRWLTVTGSNKDKFGHTVATIQGRMFTGLATGVALETGVSTHHTYGMPMISGSSVKGAARAYANSIGLDGRYLAVLFGEDEEQSQQAEVKRDAGAGSLVWHDAWWVPDRAQKPFVADVVTVHHQNYYLGSGAATDFDSPVPNQQIGVQGSFYFVVEGDAQWVALALQLLNRTLEQQGLGAKGAAGYGYFLLNKKLEDKLEKDINELVGSTLSEEDRLKRVLNEMNENELAEAFGTGRAPFQKKHGLESLDLAKSIAMSLHEATIKGWQNEKSKPKKKAYKFLMGQDSESND